MLASKELIMGFGHRVYTTCDPRSDIIKKWSFRLGEEKGNLLLYHISERIEEIMWQEKKLFPNLDFIVHPLIITAIYQLICLPQFL